MIPCVQTHGATIPEADIQLTKSSMIPFHFQYKEGKRFIQYKEGKRFITLIKKVRCFTPMYRLSLTHRNKSV